MKKWLALLFGVVVIVGIYLVAREMRYVPIWLQPKFAKIERGDIRVPISASGLIQPRQHTDVKSEASGEVLEVRVREGDFVRAGDTLVVIKQDDERRSVERAEADVARSQALLAQAKIAVEEAQRNVEVSNGRLEDLKAQAMITEYEVKHQRELFAKNLGSPQQLNDAEARHRMTQAQIGIAETNIASAKLAIDNARQQVIINEANVRVAEKNLGDAQERLSETSVIASQGGIVTNVFVTPGTVIQSATATFTGGTTLLQIADISALKVIARVDETSYGRVLEVAPTSALPQVPELLAAAEASAEELTKRSGVVQLTVDPFPDEIFEGVIDRAEPQGSLSAGSSVIQFDVHILITDEKRYKLPLGAQAQVEFTVDSALDVLRVPAEAVKSEGEKRGLYLRMPPAQGEQWGKRFVPVAFGITDGNHTQIVRAIMDDELKEGMEVYIKLPVEPDEE